MTYGSEAISTPYYTDAFSMKTPRYYRQIAINRTIETVARGQKRVMLLFVSESTAAGTEAIHGISNYSSPSKLNLAKRVCYS